MRTTRREWLVRAASLAAASAAPSIIAAADPAAADDDARPEDEAVVLVPAGPFLMGTTREQAEELARRHGHHPSWLSGEVPQRRVEVPGFRIDRVPVTNRRFAAFCAATGREPPLHWGGREPPRELLDHPVVLVNLADAVAFARWAGKRLPTEAEWEKAARGAGGRLYPWGDEFDPAACHFDRGGLPGASLSSLPQHLAEELRTGAHWLPAGTAPVASHPKGASPYGVLDLSGNVAEWCSDSPGPGSAIIKGGCWLTASPLNLRAASRNQSGFANNRLAFVGFRCAEDLDPREAER